MQIRRCTNARRSVVKERLRSGSSRGHAIPRQRPLGCRACRLVLAPRVQVGAHASKTPTKPPYRARRLLVASTGLPFPGPCHAVARSPQTSALCFHRRLSFPSLCSSRVRGSDALPAAAGSNRFCGCAGDRAVVAATGRVPSRGIARVEDLQLELPSLEGGQHPPEFLP